MSAVISDQQLLLPLRPKKDGKHGQIRAWMNDKASIILKDPPIVMATTERIHFLKHLDQVSGACFTKYVNSDESGLDQEKKDMIQRVVFQSNFAGIPEGSELFYEMLKYKCLRMSCCRRLVVQSLYQNNMGFKDWEKDLIIHSSYISQSYDPYYLNWLKAVQDKTFNDAVNDTANEITKANRENEKYFLSPYTIIRAKILDGGGYDFQVEPYAVFFKDILDTVISTFQDAINALSQYKDEPEALKFATYLTCYKNALAEENVENLEAAWKLCDSAWMDTKASIQIVHDIEDGYSDPLRAKQGPDFSLRFLDETYANQNAQISDIHKLICKYYASRNTKLSDDGLTALSNTMAGIYYIPFKTGCSLVFSYSGQSIPNRLDVKKEKGVKIYFDAIETMARVEQVKLKVQDIYLNGKADVVDKFKPDAVDQLVWHVAAHEVGHAIYGIRNIANFIQKETNMMLEEPRAELTAMFTLRLLYREKVLSLEELQKHLVHFCLDAVRYFAKFNVISLQPYIVFQIHAYNLYFKHGFLKFDATNTDKLVIDVSKTLDVLDDFSNLFENGILNALDLNNEEGGNKLETILNEMRQPSDMTKKVVDLCLN
jgi:hypothetical protein